MSYIKFDKSQLINLEYALSRELIRSSRTGAFACTTILNCNTRKYHGLLIVPQPDIDGDQHVLLSTLDETIIQRETEFNLGIHKYPGGVYNPKGHKYIRDFSTDVIPEITYRVGGVVLKKERLLLSNDSRILIRYTLEDAHSPTRLRLNPFLAFRSIHSLSRENVYYNNKYLEVKNGIQLRMYPQYSSLFMQLSKKPEYTHVPHWYYNIEYFREQERGYEYQEDLYVPGFLEFGLKKGESVVFSAGLTEAHPPSLKRLFTNEISKRIPRNSFEHCLENSARQFIISEEGQSSILAGFPWYGRNGRDTFIALPGLTLYPKKDLKTFRAVADGMILEMQGPLFPESRLNGKNTYDSADTSLWFIRAVQQYTESTGKPEKCWEEYGGIIKSILQAYRSGTDLNIGMDEDGLINAEAGRHGLSWMNAAVKGKPVTARAGKTVEVNALWYNAVCFALETAEKAGDKKFINTWKELPRQIRESFIKTFWDINKGYLADVVSDSGKEWSVRPNQVFAVSLPFSPVDEFISENVLQVIRKELLTPRGLRSLSPKNPAYKGIYRGDEKEREEATHQGVAWPWLMTSFAEAWLNLYGTKGIPFVKELYQGFEKEMQEAGIGTISELYDGDPPHRPGGALSHARNVAEIIRLNYLIKKYSKTT
ncbi:MAG: amylo-alpha-1,6-glucosidase [Bacteroidales bacterium]|nr:amylo-alpha-1,6-glucosidase [Bacteroidales bacterium]MCF8350935.1 amylo-alpha-1,6-glucosidase [Bacteroidales bacterium]MCF8377414.1 amylo-alpha-1,6-glucosidase [Bacteroidales bacterium]MCF8401449.1 amylo-alpha-1,6-glucosidase [Bacteroidales bacterium]